MILINKDIRKGCQWKAIRMLSRIEILFLYTAFTRLFGTGLYKALHNSSVFFAFRKGDSCFFLKATSGILPLKVSFWHRSCPQILRLTIIQFYKNLLQRIFRLCVQFKHNFYISLLHLSGWLIKGFFAETQNFFRMHQFSEMKAGFKGMHCWIASPLMNKTCYKKSQLYCY